MSEKYIVHVAVAVIKNSDGQYFIAQRPQDSHQGGLWEFPGGKIESNESVLEALERELLEEVGITLVQASPLIQIHHDYSDKSVFLDVWKIESFTGTASGNEGQQTIWINESDFSCYDFPVANLPIIKAIQLPDKYLITGQFKDESELLNRLDKSIDDGIKLIQFRAPHLNENLYFNYAEKIYLKCQKEHVQLLLNTSASNFKKYSAHKFSHGLHLNSKELQYYSNEKLDKVLLISTSVHNHEELIMAEEKNVDFIVLSPVKRTLSHPDAIPLGWDKFKFLTEKAIIPVFALGGMKEDDLVTIKNNGGQGIAAIGAFWNVK